MTRSTRRLFHYFVAKSPFQLWEELRGGRCLEGAKVPIKGRAGYLSADILMHLFGVGGALAIVTLNLTSFWIGKELTGTINQNGIKMLWLQLTAKVHELCMLASLGSVLCSQILGLVASGKALPFGALIATQNFRQVSFLWSSEFISLCFSKFGYKTLVLSVTIAVTVLSFSAGPSSATGLIPVMTDWPATKMQFAMNTTFEDLWPTTIDLSGNSIQHENEGTLDKFTLLTANLFQFWGSGGLGTLPGMIETVHIPGMASVRSLNVRFRGPATFYSPTVTAATIQMVAIADALAALYWIWNALNTPTCRWAKNRQPGSQCTSQDVKSVITAQQPVAYVKCAQNQDPANPSFPIINGDSRPLPSKAAGTNSFVRTSNVTKSSSLIEWVDLASRNVETDSIGVLIQPIDSITSISVGTMYACTVNAQWANASAQSSFLQGPYQISGMPSFFFAPESPGSEYHGQNVGISPTWAALANPLIDSANGNMTAFDKLLLAGSLQNPASVLHKIEAVLAVLIVERMSWIGSHASVLAEIDIPKRILRSNAAASVTTVKNPYKFELVTVITGYGYGLQRASGISAGIVFSVVMLLAYCVVIITYLFTNVLYTGVCVDAWDNVTELICLALQSPPSQEMINTNAGVDAVSTLQTPVKFVVEGNNVHMITSPPGKRQDTRSPEKHQPYGTM